MECQSTTATTFNINGERVLMSDSYGSSSAMQRNSNAIIVISSSRNMELVIGNKKPVSSQIIAYKYRRIGTNT